MTSPILLAAKLIHKFFPFCQLRTANLILRWNQHKKNVRVVCDLFGYKISLDIYRSTGNIELWIKGEKYIEDIIFLGPHIRNGMVAFDVGANIGSLTYFLCKEVGARGRVFSFEPDPGNYRELCDNIGANNISYCQPFQTAVGSFDGIVAFAYGVNGYVDIRAGADANCRIISLDSFVREHSISQIDVVKVDVEGYELDVLAGMSQILSRKRKPLLYVEVHPLGLNGKGEPAKVCSFLERYYNSITAFRPIMDVRAGLSSWGKFLIEMSSTEGLRRTCQVSLKDVKEKQGFRYQLLCLPPG